MADRLTKDQVQQEIQKTPGWELKNGEITKVYKFKDFVEAMAFVNRVAALSEAADHHPDINIRYNKVRLVLSTHSAGGLCAEARGGVSSNAGLTSKDFSLAKQIG